MCRKPIIQSPMTMNYWHYGYRHHSRSMTAHWSAVHTTEAALPSEGPLTWAPHSTTDYLHVMWLSVNVNIIHRFCSVTIFHLPTEIGLLNTRSIGNELNTVMGDCITSNDFFLSSWQLKHGMIRKHAWISSHVHWAVTTALRRHAADCQEWTQH